MRHKEYIMEILIDYKKYKTEIVIDYKDNKKIHMLLNKYRITTSKSRSAAWRYDDLLCAKRVVLITMTSHKKKPKCN